MAVVPKAAAKVVKAADGRRGGAASGRRKAAAGESPTLARRLAQTGLILLTGVMLAAITLGVYWRTYQGKLLLDDYRIIMENTNVREMPMYREYLRGQELGPYLGRVVSFAEFALTHPRGTPNPYQGQLGPTEHLLVSQRPLLYFSLMLEYDWHGLVNPQDMPAIRRFHVVNMIFHLVAGLALFGIIRRTLLTAPLRERFGRHSLPLAAAAALLWMVHPLHTGAVTYVIQRAEAMMGMFFLLTLYCGIRGMTGGRRVSRVAWLAASVLACATGMGVKEVMVTAPLMVLLWDVIFIRQWRQAVRRLVYYVPLFATMLILEVLVGLAPACETAGFDFKYFTGFDYALTQFGVISRYIGLAFWPAELCMDYGGLPVTANWRAGPVLVVLKDILPYAVLVLGLFGASVAALFRRPALAFAGLWFFLILAPSSSIMPIADMMFEHRVYLSLAALVTVVVLTAYWLGTLLLSRLNARAAAGWGVGIAATAIVACALGWRTDLRNQDYTSEVRIYGETVRQRPDNARAQRNFGVALALANRLDDAMVHLKISLDLDPSSAEGHNNYGVGIKRQSAGMRVKAQELRKAGQAEQAAALEAQAEDLYKRSMRHYRQALAITPEYGDAQGNLAVSLAEMAQQAQAQGRADDAAASYKEATGHILVAARLKPYDPETFLNLGSMLGEQGRYDEAVEAINRCVMLAPGHVQAYYSLALVRVRTGKIRAAVENFARIVQIQRELKLPDQPIFIDARRNVALGLAQLGQTAESIKAYREFLATKPDDVLAMNHLAWLLSTTPREELAAPAEAVPLAQAACKAANNGNPQFVETLAAAHARCGKFDLAVQAQAAAVKLWQQASLAPQARVAQERLQLYSAGKAFKEYVQPPPE